MRTTGTRKAELHIPVTPVSSKTKELARKCAKHIASVGFSKNKLFQCSSLRTSVQYAPCCMMGAAAYCSQGNPNANVLQVASVMNMKNVAYSKLIITVLRVLGGDTAVPFSPANFNDNDLTDKQDVIDVFNFIATLP